VNIGNNWLKYRGHHYYPINHLAAEDLAPVWINFAQPDLAKDFLQI
jgi:hypothetical protein